MVNTNLVVALLVVIAVLSYGQIVKAGNLDPPGPPAPTKLLIEPRLPIRQADIPKTINIPGSYYLTENVTAAGTAITVTVDDVTIDLMGYTLKGPDSGVNSGIYINCNNVEIRNGTVREFYYGIYGSDPNNLVYIHRVIDVRAVSNGLSGIVLEGRNNLVKDCSVSDNGHGATSSEFDVCGIFVSTNSTVTGNTVCNNGTSSGGDWVCGIRAGSSCTVTGNTVYNNGAYATDPNNLVSGIYAGNNSTVIGNTINRNGIRAKGDVYGIFAVEACTLTGNTIYGNGYKAGGNVYGIKAFGINTEIFGGSTVTGNTVYGNGFGKTGSNKYIYGIYVGSGSTVIGNTAKNNGESAAATVTIYGIWLEGNSLVDQNTAYNNKGNGGGGTDLTYGVAGCVYGINVPPPAP